VDLSEKNKLIFLLGTLFLQRVWGILAKNARRGILSNYPKKGAFLSDFVRFGDKGLRFFVLGFFPIIYYHFY
jgi:hypothetical protein